MNAPVLPRIRVRYAKHGKIRFTSHRDMARIWERALRKINFPVAYSQGFSPRPKLSFGLALPTGAESNGEYFDIVADSSWNSSTLDELVPKLNTAVPIGIEVQAAAVQPVGAESLQSAVQSCTWAIDVGGQTRADLDQWVENLLASDQLVVTRERKGKPVEDDLRPLVLALESVEPATGRLGLVAEVSTVGRTLRPAELLAAIEPHLSGGSIRRLFQWINVDGAPCEPLAVGAAVDQRTHVGAR